MDKRQMSRMDLDKLELMEAFKDLKEFTWSRIHVCSYEGIMCFYMYGLNVEQVLNWYNEVREIYEELIDGY